MPTAWRIVKRKFARDAFSGEGSRLYGGRWNNPGTPLVYTAGSQSLAALELLVHLESADLLDHYVIFEVNFESTLVSSLDSALPKHWDSQPIPSKNRALGDAWARDRTSTILRMPSVLIPSEHNYILNPRHPKFAKIRMGKQTPFRLHPRLLHKLK